MEFEQWYEQRGGTLSRSDAYLKWCKIQADNVPRRSPQQRASKESTEANITSCCKLKALAVFRTVNGETRVDITCRKCKRVIEPNLPQKEAIRRARKGNFYLIEPSEDRQ